MELWLLGVGALVLITITLWIVWPASIVDPVRTPVPNEEVLNRAMSESTLPVLPPQGDRFEDQYTSVNADLSPGGIAAAVQSMQDDEDRLPASVTPSTGLPSSATPRPVTPYPAGPPSSPTAPPAAASPTDRWPEASTAGEHIGRPSMSENFPYDAPASNSSSFAQPRTVGLGAGALVSVAAAVGGAWYYARWQRERNKPINRLRRAARETTSQLSERFPDVVDELPGRAAPMGGAAAALLLASLMAARTRRRDSDDTNSDTNTDAVLQVAQAVGKQQARRLLLDRLPAVEQPRPAVLGIGFGGLAIVAGGSYLVWRLLRGSEAELPQQNWYAGDQTS